MMRCLVPNRLLERMKGNGSDRNYPFYGMNSRTVFKSFFFNMPLDCEVFFLEVTNDSREVGCLFNCRGQYELEVR